jgi:hypothetical protein
MKTVALIVKCIMIKTGRNGMVKEGLVGELPISKH